MLQTVNTILALFIASMVCCIIYIYGKEIWMKIKTRRALGLPIDGSLPIHHKEARRKDFMRKVIVSALLALLAGLGISMGEYKGLTPIWILSLLGIMVLNNKLSKKVHDIGSAQ